ncbi:MAG TPA: hypothetical protein VGH28_34225 [Polyangiaceae bacterium]|jgi:hypothetical protein
MKRAALAVLLACGSPQTTRVDLPPAPTASADPHTASLDDLACKPHGLVAIDPDPSGALDAVGLNAALLSARDFAQRCCAGDETGDATVRVTVSPEGYDTRVEITPENLAGGATGACVYASFHRVVVKGYRGEPSTTDIVVRIR